MRRGQPAVEFLAVVAMFLLLTVPVFMYFYVSAPQKEYYASLSQAEAACNEFIKYGAMVGVQSEGTKISRLIVLPKHAQKITLNGTSVSIFVKYGNLESDVVRMGPAMFEYAEIDLPSGGTYSFVFENMGGKVHVRKEFV